MHAQHYFFTSESVSEGHPDKVADQISDAILDSLLAHDPHARVACETLVTTGLAVVAGEVTVHTAAANDALGQAEETVRATIKKIGYTNDPSIRFDDTSCAVIRTLHGQSADIARGVDHASDNSKEPGAGDQGLMFGYACRETPELMPLPIHLSHRLVEKQAEVRRQNRKIPGLRPDAKSQVTIEYDAKNKPVRIDTVVLSTQHDARWNGAKKQKELKALVIKHIIAPVMPKKLFDAKKVTVHVNPTGQFEIGGPHGDTGLTGRKIIVDSYGGKGRHGGGAFSGKDPSKVDRSAAYMARYVAKNLVASGLCDECEVQLSYAIGVAEPTSVFINAFGSNRIPEADLVAIVRKFVPLTPRGIINHLKLRAPIYSPTAAYGHFGRTPGTVTVAGKAHETFTWEKTDLAEKFRKAAGLR